MKPILALFLLSLFVSGCRFNASYQNREVDRKEAEQVTEAFYAALKNKDYSKTFQLFSTRFFEVLDTGKLFQLYKNTNSRLGDVKRSKLNEWQTLITRGSNSRAEYLFQYEVERTKFNSTETLRLEKEGNQIKILRYNINSDGLLEN